MENIFDLLGKEDEEVIEALGIPKNAPDEERAEMLDHLEGHLEGVILDTAIESMEDASVLRLRHALSEGREAFYEELTTQCTAVPGLSDRLGEAVEHEIAVLMEARAKLG